MRIVDLADDSKDVFCVCLEDWNPELREAGTKRRDWVERGLAERGLRAKLALDEHGVAGGMIQYGPVENSFVDGADLYFIYCIWVHGHKQGRGDFRKRGMGEALLAAAEADARTRGAAGMAAWGIWLPAWMKASWFRRHGYHKVDREGMAVLLWKPFTAAARPPKWYRDTGQRPEPVLGRVNVTIFSCGWCAAMNLVHERVRRACAECGERVVVREIDTSSRAAMAEWGVSDAVFVDGRALRMGPPPSYESIRKTIRKRVRKLSWS